VFDDAGHESYDSTTARTVEDFLLERDIHVVPGDFVSGDGAQPLTPGMRLTYRPERPLVLVDGGVRHELTSTALTVGQLLDQEDVALGPHDEVFPSAQAYLATGEVVRVDRIASWTVRVKQHLASRTQERFDAGLPVGSTLTVARGSAGLRVATVRYERHNGEPPTKRILGYQIIRAATPRIVVHGARPFQALQNIAAAGFAGALQFAGAALHVIATAYTSSCYGCSGLTASGGHAGVGIIAVDPRVIPLGSHLYIPGYGRAIAGDTGGAIVGRRVDLGFPNVTEALRFGSREVTVYVVK
jgi:3D (Asp-Asp-Asp) domain-containing protein